MQSKRTTILVAILLVLVFGYVSAPLVERLRYSFGTAPLQPVLKGENRISNFEVHRNPKGNWVASFDYFYTGEPNVAVFNIELSRASEPATSPTPGYTTNAGFLLPERGEHRAAIVIQRPSVFRTTTTKVVVASLRSEGRTLVSKEVPQVIEWPDHETASLESELAAKGPDVILARAVSMINDDNQAPFYQAKTLLERLLRQDPRYVPAYVELARVAMKTNWGPEGLHQAETLLDSALQIQPDHVNAKVLLGYVYAHQKRFKLADALFEEAERANSTNLWTWANWGESLAMQGKTELAIAKYREGLARPRTDAANDRARTDAYQHLIRLLEQRKDVAGQEELYKKRVEDFGSTGCFNGDYARFVLQQRGDWASALAIARAAIDAKCQDDPKSRTALGLAYYVAWANSTGPERAESLNQARVFLPAGPGTLFLLASSDRTVLAAKQLVAAGEQVDQRDNYKLNAMAYALRSRDYPTGRRLLQLGARPEAPVTEGEMPVALLPVVTGDLDGILLMQKAGVDYAKLRYQGSTAVEEAKRSGDRRMLDALDPKARSL